MCAQVISCQLIKEIKRLRRKTTIFLGRFHSKNAYFAPQVFNFGRIKVGKIYFFFAATFALGFVAAAFFAAAFFTGCSNFTTSGLKSPITPFTGHILKIGHFLQPTAMATGQTVMVHSFTSSNPN
jgi:hypothetical protein